MIILIFLVAIILIVVLFMRQSMFGNVPAGERLERIKKSPNFKDGKFQNLSNFAKANNDKYFKKNIGGWHIILPEPTDQEKREQLIMTMLLLDREGYGC